MERYRKEQTEKEKEKHSEKQWTNAIGGGMLPDVDLVGRVRRFVSRTAKQEPLEERVKNYMQAQIDGKWDRAYSFFDSSSREKV